MKRDEARLRAELRRLPNGPSPGESPQGMGTVRFIAACPPRPSEVVSRVVSIIRVVDENSLAGWPDDSQWAKLLPSWFVGACGPEQTKEEAELWLASWKKLAPAAQARAEEAQPWSLSEWLYWMNPDRRPWYWWDSRVFPDQRQVHVAIEVDDWPFPWGALRWLFKASGATSLEAEE